MMLLRRLTFALLLSLPAAPFARAALLPSGEIVWGFELATSTGPVIGSLRFGLARDAKVTLVNELTSESAVMPVLPGSAAFVLQVVDGSAGGPDQLSATMIEQNGVLAALRVLGLPPPPPGTFPTARLA